LREALRVLVLENPWIPHNPTDKQAEFLLCFEREAFYGGAAGGGKSDALLMAALMFVESPGYAALLLRRTYKDLSLPKALMDRAGEWLGPTAAKWDDVEKRWTFPSGATLTFGYLKAERDKYQYQSAEFQFIGFDELTQFTETQYRYLSSRRRRLEGVGIPLRTRTASNPGGGGHEWVKRRFVTEGALHGRPFIPARLEDNPHLDIEEYEESLAELDPVTRAQLRSGDWDIAGGSKFQRQWFPIVSEVPADMKLVRRWDLAATDPKEGGEPDYTAGALVGLKDGIWYVCDMRRVRRTPGEVEKLVRQTAQVDGKPVAIGMEQEPGASGKSMIAHYRNDILVGFDFRGYPSTGSKEIRANPVSSAAEAGNVRLLEGSWNGAFLDEFEAFPQGTHDDQVDSVSGAFDMLTGKKLGTARTTQKRFR
jgi:predicted phage terminase large subunit-like protein